MLSGDNQEDQDSVMDQAKHDNIHQNKLYEESDHNNAASETDFCTVKNSKVTTRSVPARRKLPETYKEMECQTELDMETIVRLSNLEKLQKSLPHDELDQSEAYAPNTTTSVEQVKQDNQSQQAQPNTARNKA